MPSLRQFVWSLLILCVAATWWDMDSFPESEIIYRDVAIIGGGSTGTYTAVRLRDQNYSIALIEPKDRLGGHAETYTAPNGWTIDIGVIVFAQSKAVKEYLSRFNVAFTKLTSSGSKRAGLDFETGQLVPNLTVPSAADVAAGFANYATQLAKYPDLKYGFNLSYPIAADSDLLLPFGKFAVKYNFTAALPSIFIINQGYAPLLEIPTIYMLKYLNQEELNSLSNGFLTTTNHNISELYSNAAKFLGLDTNVFLSATITHIDRSKTPVRILISTPSGRKLIIAKRLVITAPPYPSTLPNIPLTPAESRLFRHFHANGYYSGVLTNTSLPSTFAFENKINDPTRYNFPRLPGIYSMTMNRGAPDHVQVYFGSPTVLSAAEVKSSIEAAIRRVQRAQGLPNTTPKWSVFTSHAPFNLMVDTELIRNGFYKDLYALQGVAGTWWGGAAWHTQDSSALWDWVDDYLVPRVVSSLKSGVIA